MNYEARFGGIGRLYGTKGWTYSGTPAWLLSALEG